MIMRLSYLALVVLAASRSGATGPAEAIDHAFDLNPGEFAVLRMEHIAERYPVRCELVVKEPRYSHKWNPAFSIFFYADEPSEKLEDNHFIHLNVQWKAGSDRNFFSYSTFGFERDASSDAGTNENKTVEMMLASPGDGTFRFSTDSDPASVSVVHHFDFIPRYWLIEASGFEGRAKCWEAAEFISG